MGMVLPHSPGWKKKCLKGKSFNEGTSFKISFMLLPQYQEKISIV